MIDGNDHDTLAAVRLALASRPIADPERVLDIIDALTTGKIGDAGTYPVAMFLVAIRRAAGTPDEPGKGVNDG